MDLAILWINEDKLVGTMAGPNLNHLASSRSVLFTRFLVEYMSRARSIDELSSE